ncbi:STAS domain-containing protein [Thermomonospora cellulosilytica]|uniref:Anti-sigma factor antagonist n=1 Tax=Thermomonospora cellulosilytica TaxID=1411118 RepID=A0A7W3R843_9ACTN|nr:STAS domain-containing protein [Thermomonospora cellulosilytica]MBA9003000.1 anti-anti-sigma factor [Thermomonospora cellulosilytica]
MTTSILAGGPSRAPTPQGREYTVVALHGDLDLATTAVLRERLLAALRHSTRLLIIDLGGVSFCDAAGLGMLVGTQRRATALGVALRLVAPRPQVSGLLRITGLDRGLTVHPTLHDALAASSLRLPARAGERRATGNAHRFDRPSPATRS